MKHALVRRLALTALLTCGCAPPVLAQGTDSGSGWIGTWTVAPVSGTENGGAGMSFSGQTLRQIVHTSIGGSKAQIQISNVFGSQSLTVSDVHMATPTTGGGIDASTDELLTFGGQNSVTIPAGSAILSDPASFPVPALGNVAISMFLPNDTGPNDTQHTESLQTNYIASGDVSGQTTLSGAQTTQSYFFLTGLDVQDSNALGAVVTLGASITDGHASTVDANRRWPNDLAASIAQAGYDASVLNEGIAGNRLLGDITGPSAESRFQRDVLDQPGVRAVIFSDDPINDLIFAAFVGGAPPAAEQFIAALQRLMSSAHAKGILFLCSTLTPYEGNAAGLAVRQQYNDFVRQSGNGCDGVVDQDAAVHDPQNPTQFLPAYDSGDHLHPNDAGYAAIAAVAAQALLSASASIRGQ